MLDPNLFAHRFILTKEPISEDNVKLTLEHAIAIKTDGSGVIRWQSHEFPDHYERFAYWWSEGNWQCAYEVALSVEYCRRLQYADTAQK